jgi:hypothetical protein
MPIKEEQISISKPFFTSKNLSALKPSNSWKFNWPERSEFTLTSKQPSSHWHYFLKDAHVPSAAPGRRTFQGAKGPGFQSDLG